ncbi:autotransporter outer membrane beta-barrel domain-containing protein [Salinispora mooreana]|uniref:hypothetical protein n=1 Tax=Salinispora mooreana TaxID=999545 RepID=UPI0003A0D54D|nr:hypothetical protein [Salinispora mooreana]
MNYQCHVHEPDRPGARRARSRWWAVGLAGVTGLALTTSLGIGGAPAIGTVDGTLAAADDRPGNPDHASTDNKGHKGKGKQDRHKGTPVPCSADALVAAITLANARGGAALDLARDCTYLLTANIDGAGLPAITTPIILNGGTHTTIKRPAATDQFRILTVDTGGDLTINHLTITGGHTTSNGGAVLVNAGGALTANRSTITRNIAGAAGGGISNFGITRIKHSTVDRNTAGSSGGGVVSTAVLEVSKSHISANTADLGGGVSTEGAARIEYSAIAANHAQSLAGGLIMESGVGIVTDARIMDNTTTGSGGIFVGSGQFTLRRSTLAGNTSTENDGGGLRSNPDASVVIEDSLVKNNTAPAATADGGGIYSAGSLVLRRTKIIGNQAGDEGGGINNESTSTAALFATKVVKNIAGVQGGGIFNEPNGTVELNTATGTTVVKNRPDNCSGDVPGCAG